MENPSEPKRLQFDVRITKRATPEPLSSETFGPCRPLTGPASHTLAAKIAEYVLGNGKVLQVLTTTGSYEAYHKALETLAPNSTSEPIVFNDAICSTLQKSTSTSDAEMIKIVTNMSKLINYSGRQFLNFPTLDNPSDDVIRKAMKPGKYFFYTSFFPDSWIEGMQAFKHERFPDYLAFWEVWKDPAFHDRYMRDATDVHSRQDFAQRASRIFAENAEGDVVVLLPKGVGREMSWKMMSMWNLEFKVLLRNEKVKSVRRIDVDGVESEMKAV